MLSLSQRHQNQYGAINQEHSYHFFHLDYCTAIRPIGHYNARLISPLNYWELLH